MVAHLSKNPHRDFGTLLKREGHQTPIILEKERMIAGLAGAAVTGREARELMTVSFGIATYNEASNIRFLLEDLEQAKLAIPEEFSVKELIIADGGSTDGTIAELRNWMTSGGRTIPLRLLQREYRAGKRSDLNQILSKATTDLLIIFDGDVRLPRNKSLLELLSDFKAHPEVQLVWGAELPSRRDLHFRASAFQMDLEWRKRTLLNRKVSIASGYFYGLRKSLYSKFRFSAGRIADDVDLADYALAHGLAVLQNPKAFVFATPAGTLRDFHLQTSKGFAAFEAATASKSLSSQVLPLRLKLRAQFQQATLDPFGAILLVLYRLASTMLNWASPLTLSDVWPIIRPIRYSFWRAQDPLSFGILHRSSNRKALFLQI